MKKNGHKLNEQTLHMYYEAPKHRPRPEGCMYVAVKKLEPEVTDDDLWRLFETLNVVDVRIVRDAAGACSGLAFVEFSDGKSVEAAVSRSGMSVRGRAVFICYDTEPKKDKSTAEEEEPEAKAERLRAKKLERQKLKSKKNVAAGKDAEPEQEETNEPPKKRKKKVKRKAVAEIVEEDEQVVSKVKKKGRRSGGVSEDIPNQVEEAAEEEEERTPEVRRKKKKRDTSGQGPKP